MEIRFKLLQQFHYLDNGKKSFSFAKYVAMTELCHTCIYRQTKVSQKRCTSCSFLSYYCILPKYWYCLSLLFSICHGKNEKALNQILCNGYVIYYYESNCPCGIFVSTPMFPSDFYSLFFI